MVDLLIDMPGMYSTCMGLLSLQPGAMALSCRVLSVNSNPFEKFSLQCRPATSLFNNQKRPLVPVTVSAFPPLRQCKIFRAIVKNHFGTACTIKCS